MQIRLVGLGLVALFVLANCGGGGENGPGGQSASLKAASPEQALSWLPAGERQAFDSWNARLTKSCAASDIFKGESADGLGIDVRHYREKVGPAFLLSDGREFAILGMGSPMTGSQTTELQTGQTENDRLVAGLEARTVREGGHCTVTLYGQKVAEVDLLGSVNVTVHYNETNATAGKNVEISLPASAAHKQNVFGTDASAYLLPVLRVLEPGVTTRDFVAKQLALPSGTGATLIQLSKQAPEAAIWSAKAPTTTAALSPRFPLLIGGRDVLAIRQAGDQDFFWALGSPGESQVRLRASVHYEPNQETGYAKASLRSLALTGVEARTSRSAAECFLRRFRLVRALKFEAPRVAEPSLAEVATPCGPVSTDFFELLVSDAEVRRAFVGVFDGVSPRPETQFGDWQIALASFATRLHSQGKDFAAVLAPEGDSLALAQGAAYFRSFDSGLKGSANASYYPQLIATSLHWALHGNAPSERTRDKLLAAIKNVGVALPESMRELILQLVYTPDSQEATLEYAAGVAPATLDSIQKARVKAEEAGVASWISEKLSRALQDRIDAEAIAKWHGTLDPAKEFAAREKARSSDFASNNNRERVIRQALTENWTAVTFALFEKIVGTAPRSPSCPYQKDLSSIADCVGMKKLSVKEEGMLSPEKGELYGEAAVSFASQLKKIQSAKSSLEYEVARRYWEPVWKRCSSAEFSKRKAAAENAVEQLVNEKDSFKTFEIERRLRVVWRDC